MKILAIATLSASLLLTATGTTAQPMGAPMMGPGMMRGGMGANVSPRHPYVMQNGVPSEYSSLSKPLTASADNMKAGRELFATRCVPCHGSSGHGDGPAAMSLIPRPSDMAAGE